MGRTDWHHEARSHELVQYLIDDNALGAQFTGREGCASHTLLRL